MGSRGLGSKAYGSGSYSSSRTAHNLSGNDILDLQRRLGQTGKDEWVYCGTSDSFSVNSFMRQNASGWVAISEQECKRIIKEVRSWMKPTDIPINTYRMVGSDWLRDNFGTVNKNDVAKLINSNKIEVVDKGFMSVSTDVNKNVFTGRGVVLHSVVPKGTELFATSNTRESELIVHDNTRSVYNRAYVKNGVLHIYGYIANKTRKSLKK